VANRMRRTWATFRTGDTPIGALGVARVFVKSEIEQAVARDVADYTVTRVIGNIQVVNDSALPTIWVAGVITQNEGVAIGDVQPSADPSSDWLWHFSWINQASGYLGPDDGVRFDVGSQRKSRGRKPELYVMIVNGSTAGDFFISGRALLLIP